MPFTTFTGVVANHAAVVGDDPGTTGTQFKTLLDKGVVDTKAFINAHIAELMDATDGTSATERLGSGTITGVAGSTPYAQMTDLKQQINDAVFGAIPADSIEDVSLKSTGIKARVTALETFPTAGGTGTALTVACSYFALTAGLSVNFIAASSNSSAATTINVNGTGAKSVYKPGGTVSPSFTAGKAYTIWYNGTSFFVKASAEGNTTAPYVLAGTTFSNDSDVGIAGTMVDRSGDTVAASISATGTTIKLRATEGYRDGTNDYVTYTDANLAATNIKDTALILGVTGNYDHEAANPITAADVVSPHVGFVNGNKVTGTVVEKVGSATVITPSTADQAIPAGRYSGATGDGKVLAVANAAAGNIKSGVVIAGVTGTALRTVRISGTVSAVGLIALAGFGFYPKSVVIDIVIGVEAYRFSWFDAPIAGNSNNWRCVYSLGPAIVSTSIPSKGVNQFNVTATAWNNLDFIAIVSES